MDNLSRQLGGCSTGCMRSDSLVNHFMYADDLALLSPSTGGFQQLLNICANYGVDFDVKYNAKKIVVMVCRTKEDMDIKFPASSFWASSGGVQ